MDVAFNYDGNEESTGVSVAEYHENACYAWYDKAESYTTRGGQTLTQSQTYMAPTRITCRGGGILFFFFLIKMKLLDILKKKWEITWSMI